MSDKYSAQNIIKSYRKRQQMGPYMIWGLAALLVLVGVIILVVWFAGPNRPALALFATRTPTPTSTSTPTPTQPTPTPSMTPTATNTPEPSATPTPSGPFEYVVQEGDNCWTISEKYKVDLLVLLAINNFGNTCPISPNDKIWVPGPDTQLPTPTDVPDTFRGEINYTVQSGDTLYIIAAKFNSTVDAIRNRNRLKNDNIEVGQTLIVPANIATQVPTKAPTSTTYPGMILTLSAQPPAVTATTAATRMPTATNQP